MTELRVAQTPATAAWVKQAAQMLRDEEASVKPTPLIPLGLEGKRSVRVIIKDESTLPTQSLKHRVARSLFQFGLCNGLIGPETHIVEASSGSAAIAEAYFARMLDLPFTAVVPGSTALAKVRAIKALGGNIEYSLPGRDLTASAAELADRIGALFMDQFQNAERASCWRGESNLAAELLRQLDETGSEPPEWIVVGVGTGGTSSAVARHLRHKGLWGRTKLCVVDPRGSIFFRQFTDPGCEPGGVNSDHIEGIGRKRPSPSFFPSLVDRMFEVPDDASIGAAHWLRSSRKLDFGPSTGTNMVGTFILADELERTGRSGTIVTLGCDAGWRYDTTVYDGAWLTTQQLNVDPWIDRCRRFSAGAQFDAPGIQETPEFGHAPTALMPNIAEGHAEIPGSRV